jgi:hypothetical protein
MSVFVETINQNITTVFFFFFFFFCVCGGVLSSFVDIPAQVRFVVFFFKKKKPFDLKRYIVIFNSVLFIINFIYSLYFFLFNQFDVFVNRFI